MNVSEKGGGGVKKSLMKGAQSTSSIPTYRGSLRSSNLGAGDDGPWKAKFKSVCSGLDKSGEVSFSKRGSSSSRPSSIPRLIPLTNSQKKGHLLRTIVARTLKEAQRQGDFNERPGKVDKDELAQGAPKRPRLAHPSASATSTSSFLARDSSAVRGARASEIQKNQEIYTTGLREQITKFFGTTSGKPSNLGPINPACEYFDPLQATVDPYTLEIFTRELRNEALHYKLTSTRELDSQFTKRTETVNWIRKAGRLLQLQDQTLHVAVYIVDAYLRVQNVPYYSLQLFGAAALFIAAKQEETDCTLSVIAILRNCNAGCTPKRLINWETKILNKLKFKICCPTSLFFMEACASQMNYRDQFVKTFCHQMAKRLLFESLFEAEMVFTPNSKKARVALHYVVKYVSYNYDLLRVHEKDAGVWDKFKAKCFPEFRSAALSGVSLPKRLSCMSLNPPPKSGALRDLTNKGLRQSQAPDVSTTHTSSRVTRSSARFSAK